MRIIFGFFIFIQLIKTEMLYAALGESLIQCLRRTPEEIGINGKFIGGFRDAISFKVLDNIKKDINFIFNNNQVSNFNKKKQIIEYLRFKLDNQIQNLIFNSIKQNYPNFFNDELNGYKYSELMELHFGTFIEEIISDIDLLDYSTLTSSQVFGAINNKIQPDEYLNSLFKEFSSFGMDLITLKRNILIFFQDKMKNQIVEKFKDGSKKYNFDETFGPSPFADTPISIGYNLFINPKISYDVFGKNINFIDERSEIALRYPSIIQEKKDEKSFFFEIKKNILSIKKANFTERESYQLLENFDENILKPFQFNEKEFRNIINDKSLSDKQAIAFMIDYNNKVAQQINAAFAELASKLDPFSEDIVKFQKIQKFVSITLERLLANDSNFYQILKNQEAVNLDKILEKLIGNLKGTEGELLLLLERPNVNQVGIQFNFIDFRKDIIKGEVDMIWKTNSSKENPLGQIVWTEVKNTNIDPYLDLPLKTDKYVDQIIKYIKFANTKGEEAPHIIELALLNPKNNLDPNSEDIGKKIIEKLSVKFKDHFNNSGYSITKTPDNNTVVTLPNNKKIEVRITDGSMGAF